MKAKLVNTIIVDDEAFDANNLFRAIDWNMIGIQIERVFSNPIAALDFIEENEEIDLLLLDIQMPILSGLELFEAALTKNASIKAVFISGYEDFKFAKKAIDLSASAYILKPIDYSELVNSLKKVVKDICCERSEMEKSEPEELHKGLCESIDQYIEEHLEGDITISKIAAEYHYTPNYISTQFKLYKGVTLGAYLTEQKIERAISMLIEENKNVAEICRLLNYSTPSYFIHLFKKVKGTTPGQYKMRYK